MIPILAILSLLALLMQQREMARLTGIIDKQSGLLAARNAQEFRQVVQEDPKSEGKVKARSDPWPDTARFNSTEGFPFLFPN